MNHKKLMRLPYSKVYRAFPELDRLTDAQCEEYVRQVRRRFRGGRRVHALLVGAGTLVLGVLIFVGMVTVFVIGGNRYGSGVLVEYPLLGAVVLAAGTGAPPMLVMYAVRHAWLRRRIRAHMKEIRCVQCHYLLLRLTVERGVVTCPECGTRVVLESLGLTPADVMGTIVEADAAPNAPSSVPAPEPSAAPIP
jgi:hypothetical protein